MKVYASIPFTVRRRADEAMHTFAKLDGSNVRAEWEVRGGWVRFGTRHQPLTAEHPHLGDAIAIFQATLAEPLARVAFQRWPSMVVFMEYLGEHSFVGRHEPDEPHRLVLFDAAPHRLGILDPEAFLSHFGHLEVAPYLGVHGWDGELRRQVAQGVFPGMSFEGVVGKAGQRHGLHMVKAKSRAWREAVIERYGLERLQELDGAGPGITDDEVPVGLG